MSNHHPDAETRRSSLGWPGAGSSGGASEPLGWPSRRTEEPSSTSAGAEPPELGTPEPAADTADNAGADGGRRLTRERRPAPLPPPVVPSELGRPRRKRRKGRVAAVVAGVVVVAVVAAGGLFAFGPESMRELVVAPASPTPTVPRPTPTTVPPALGTPTAAAEPRADAVSRQLGSLLSSKALGTRFGAYVADPVTGTTLLDRRGTSAVTPASTAKIATSVAALEVLGPDARITTSVVRAGDTVVLVGGGDPTLVGPAKQPKRSDYPTFAKLSTLAADAADAIRDEARAGESPLKVRVDDSLFSGPSTGPGWKPNYVPEGSVAPIHALMVDHGRRDPRKIGRVGDPALDAGRQFAALLAKEGVDVAGGVARTKAAADDATQLAQVQSPTIAELVEEALTYSDNEAAEALARQVALKEGQPASFTGGATAVEAVLTRLGVGSGIALADGSGLSTKDRVTPAGLTGVLRMVAAGKHPELSAVLSGMPVGGFSGTLADRFGGTGGTRGIGVVRAKTGTLDGVSSLAGYVQDEDGRVLVFAFVANGIPDAQSFQTRPALDRLAAALAGCGCSK